jgi:glycosyltransferase involved in cell wall biosynthesis
MQILVISTFPPTKCGVGTYAAEQVARLMEAGHSVTKVTMAADSTADQYFYFRTLPGMLRWLMFCVRSRYDEIYVHYADNFYFPYSQKKTPAGPIRHLLQTASLRILGKRANKGSHVVLHEFMGTDNLTLNLRRVRSFAFGGYTHLDFHTQSNLNEFLKAYPSIKKERTHIIEHSQNMAKRFRGTRADARGALNLPLDKKIFLCLGFITPSKGFDLAVEAFREVDGPNAELHLVGSVQTSRPLLVKYADDLRSLVEQTKGAFLYTGFVDDEIFDQWLCAADLLILPYRSVISSGVGARASLYKTPLAISDLRNLQEQLPFARVFRSVDELALIMAAIA